jgi:hypothetical protein
MLIHTIVITELVFCSRQYAAGQNVLISFHVYISMQYYERAKPISWKTPPHCNAATSNFHSWHYTRWQVSFSRHSPHPNTHRTATWYSMIHHSKSHISNCPLSSGVALYTTLGGACSQAKYLVYGQLLVHGTPFLLTLDAQSCAGWTIHSTAELTGDCFNRCVASFTNYLLRCSMVPVSHWTRPTRSWFHCGCAFTFPLHNHVTSPWHGQLEKGCIVPDWFLTDVATNN